MQTPVLCSCAVTLDRQSLSALAHADHPVAAPLSDVSVQDLLRALPVPDGGRVADLGCGAGEWLVRLLTARPRLHGTGVDLSPHAIAAARAAAEAAGVAHRATWREGDAGEPLGVEVDAALCVGSVQVFGGLADTLAALREQVRPGGALLVGDGFWEQPPSDRLRELIGDLPDLAGAVRSCEDAGWAPVAGHVSTAAEWDAYEWAWTGSLTRWALAHGGPDGEQALAVAREHRQEWLAGYRGRLGFVTLALQDARQLSARPRRPCRGAPS